MAGLSDSPESPVTIRIRDKSRPYDASKDILLGPAHGTPQPWHAMKRTIDEAIVYAADHHRVIRVNR